MNEVFLIIKATLEAASTTQTAATVAWHNADPEVEPISAEVSVDSLSKLILAQHLQNFLLWHVEDKARRVDVGDSVIADCKRAVDKLNQKRNDLMEKIDASLVALMEDSIPERSTGKHNTETIGMSIDRLSILALKIFHMKEQTERVDASAEHRQACLGKLEVLKVQRANLLQSVLELVDDYSHGKKTPIVYHQFKMYNDPSLNPELYGAKG